MGAGPGDSVHQCAVSQLSLLRSELLVEQCLGLSRQIFNVDSVLLRQGINGAQALLEICSFFTVGLPFRHDFFGDNAGTLQELDRGLDITSDVSRAAALLGVIWKLPCDDFKSSKQGVCTKLEPGQDFLKRNAHAFCLFKLTKPC